MPIAGAAVTVCYLAHLAAGASGSVVSSVPWPFVATIAVLLYECQRLHDGRDAGGTRAPRPKRARRAAQRLELRPISLRFTDREVESKFVDAEFRSGHAVFVTFCVYPPRHTPPSPSP